MKRDHTWSFDLVFLAFLLGGVFFVFLGVRPLFTPDEGRYAEIAREMAFSNNYITPHLNGILYFEKPILFYWFEVIAIKIGGLNLWSLRSVNGILSLMGCLATYVTVRKLYNRPIAFLATLILASSCLYFVMTHMISLDLPVTVFLTITLYSFLLGYQTKAQYKHYYFWLAAFAASLAVLTKGLIGLVFPFFIISIWLSCISGWRNIKCFYLLSSFLIFMLIVAPWHILAELRNPGFFHFYFIQQQFLRYTMKGIGHYQPVGFFIPYLIIGFFPWSVFLPQALGSALVPYKEKKVELFLLIWAIFIFAFFSLSKSKLIPYILPVFPPLAILVAVYLQKIMQNKKPPRSVQISYLCLLFISAFVVFAFYSYSHHTPLPNQSMAIFYLNLAALFLVIGMLIAFVYSFFNLFIALCITLLTSGAFLITALAAFPHIDTRTILPLANTLRPLLKENSEVIAFNQYYQDLPFYLNRRISVLNWQNELSYGMQKMDTRAWMLQDADFWRDWDGKERVFVVMGLDEYQTLYKKYPKKHFYMLNRTLHNGLISNQPNLHT